MGFGPETASTKVTMKFFILSLLAASAVASAALNRDDECPTLEQIGQAFEEHFQIPDVDVDVEALMDACMSGSEDCPTLDDAVDFLQNELGADLDDETIAGIYNCAGDILSQLGFARK